MRGWTALLYGTNGTSEESFHKRASAAVHGGGHSGATEVAVLEWALIFLALSAIAGVLGFTSPAEISATAAKILSGLYLLIFLVLLALGLMAGESFF